MKLTLLARPQLSDDFLSLMEDIDFELLTEGNLTPSQVVALTAIRTCYSHLDPADIFATEGNKYFGNLAQDGSEGSDADRLIRHIINSGHTSTMEHGSYVFTLSGLSRSALAQFTRHRQFSFSVQSQRYVKFGSKDRSKGFHYTVPKTVKEKDVEELYEAAMIEIQAIYDNLRKEGVTAEDARYVLPNAATCNLVFSGNLRTLLEFYSKRGKGTHAQAEIQELAETIKKKIIEVEPWTKPFWKVK
jgi:thymidylate synthase (FAD)